MKKVLLMIVAVLVAVTSAFSQAKKPTIMVVPSDVWCNQNGYMMSQTIMGVVETSPDYSKALSSNSDLQLAISKLGELMSDNGFPLKDLSATLKSIQTSNAENSVIAEEEGGVVESSLDILRSTAKADIWLNLTWIVNRTGPKSSITYNLQAIDAYTNKQVAATSGTGSPSFSSELPILLEEAIVSRMDLFTSQLQSYFDDLFTNGREVALELKVSASSDVNLESEVGDDILSFIIEDWVADNTVRGQFNTSDATANVMKFEQVRIPMVLENGRSIDTRYWARGLMRELMTKYKLRVSLGMRGLGQAYLVINGTNE